MGSVTEFRTGRQRIHRACSTRGFHHRTVDRLFARGVGALLELLAGSELLDMLPFNGVRGILVGMKSLEIVLKQI